MSSKFFEDYSIALLARDFTKSQKILTVFSTMEHFSKSFDDVQITIERAHI